MRKGGREGKVGGADLVLPLPWGGVSLRASISPGSVAVGCGGTRGSGHGAGSGGAGGSSPLDGAAGSPSAAAGGASVLVETLGSVQQLDFLESQPNACAPRPASGSDPAPGASFQLLHPCCEGKRVCARVPLLRARERAGLLLSLSVPVRLAAAAGLGAEHGPGTGCGSFGAAGQRRARSSRSWSGLSHAVQPA